MKKIINKLNIEKLLVIFLLLQPIIDLITSLSVRFYGSFATLGVLIKGLFLAFLVFFVIFKYKFKDRKLSTIFIIAFIIYEISYLLINITFKSNIVLMSEIKGSIKTFFAPITIIFLYDIMKNEKFNFKSRYFAYILIEYVLLIFIANITGTAFETYKGEKAGTIGWFYAGNDISTILITLFPILYFSTVKSFKMTLIPFLFLSIYVILKVGTKVTLLGLILVICTLLVLATINFICKRNKFKIKKNLLLLLTMCLFVAIVLPFSPAIGNLKLQYDNNNIKNDNPSNKNPDKDKDKEVIDDMVFSGRTKFKNRAIKRFKNADPLQKAFGLGYVNNKNVEYKLVERDQYDIFFNHGIIGTILIFSILIYFIIIILKSVFSRRLDKSFRMNIEAYAIAILLMFGISFYSGHVLLNPAVSIYFSVLLVSLFFRVNGKFKKIKNNKITIMSLHLKPGGIEKFISTTSSFLSKKYDVEVVCVYEYEKDKIIDLNKNVKVKYLLDKKYKPNKEIIKENLANKRYLSALKELIFAVKIVLLKNIKMKKYIKNCDSSIIISTRLEHNSILSEYAKSNVLKIVTEHNYYTDKYSKKIVNSCSEIDYFIVSTEDQKNYYEELFKGLNTRVLKIPFALDSIPKESSKLNNYNLISVGRLSKEKGFDDMINIFLKLVEKEPKFNLKIIGYGVEEKSLSNQIKELKLDKKVTLCGRKNSEEIEKELLNSSLFLLTSHTESFGIVLIEAMSCGVPCIIFDSAKGALELVTNDYNGYVIKNRNLEQYVDTIVKLFKNKKQLQKLGKNSKEKSNEFNIKEIEKQWLNILEEKL